MVREPVTDLDGDPRLAGPWISVPVLLMQLLAHAGDLDLGEVAHAVGRGAGARAADVRLPWPLPDAVVGLVVGLCVEFGIATWDGDVHTLGHAEITPLGLWAQLTLRAHIEEELPPGFAEATVPAHVWNCALRATGDHRVLPWSHACAHHDR